MPFALSLFQFFVNDLYYASDNTEVIFKSIVRNVLHETLRIKVTQILQNGAFAIRTQTASVASFLYSFYHRFHLVHHRRIF